MRKVTDETRRFCSRGDHVFGDMRALVRYPMKLIWYANYPPQLYDLSLDAQEERDLAPAEPALVAQLEADLARRVRRPAAGAREAAPSAETVGRETLERLRALGYVAGEPVHAP